MQLRKNRPLLHEEVLKALYEYIDEQEIEPGGKFPSEQALIARWGVSRNVLREAFHVLETRGVVVSHQGKGRYLRKLPDSQFYAAGDTLTRGLERSSLLEIFELRRELECLAVRLVARNATDEDIAEIEETCDKLAEQFESSRSTSGEFVIHKKYAEKSRNPLLIQFLMIILKNILDMMSTTFRDILASHDIEDNLETHRRLIDTFKAHDEEAAAALMGRHMQTTIDKLKSAG